MNYSLGEWAQATGGKILAGDPAMLVGGDGPGGLSIDSRNVANGQWFIALKGTSGRDGHEFIESAISKGGAGLIISDIDAYRKISRPEIPTLLVADTTIAMGDAARAMLLKHRPFVIAITGTVGKTSVKENVAHIASSKWKTLKNELNWNTEIGVPLTIFNLEPDHEVIVLECASRGAGQINYLSMIAQPHVAVITSIGAGHLSEFGTIDDVAEAKWEIVDGLRDTGVVVASGDSEYTNAYTSIFPVVTFGMKKSCDFHPVDITAGPDSTDCTIGTPEGSFSAAIPGISIAELVNAVCATAIASQINPQTYGNGFDRYSPLTFEEIAESVKTLPTISGRMEKIIRASGIEVIFDAYNSNPQSLANALDMLVSRQSLSDGSPIGRKVAILGDMLELGSDEIKYHLDAGKNIAEINIAEKHNAEINIDCLITVGDLARNIRDAAEKASGSKIPGAHYDTTSECASHLGEWLKPGDLVLMKASRTLGFEKLMEGDW